jgi:hypothetical protein
MAWAEKSWNPRPPDDIGKCAMCLGCILGITSVMLHPRELKRWPSKIGGA